MEKKSYFHQPLYLTLLGKYGHLFFRYFRVLNRMPFAYFILNIVWTVIIELFVLSSSSGDNNTADLHKDFLLFFCISDDLLQELYLKCKVL